MLRSESGHVTDNFGLFTKISVCKLLHGWQSYGLELLLFFSIVCVYTFFLHLFVRRIVPKILLGILRHRNVHYYY